MPPVPSIQAKVSKNANIKAPLAVKMQPIPSQTPVNDSIDEYGAWTDPTFIPEAKKT